VHARESVKIDVLHLLLVVRSLSLPCDTYTRCCFKTQNVYVPIPARDTPRIQKKTTPGATISPREWKAMLAETGNSVESRAEGADSMVVEMHG